MAEIERKFLLETLPPGLDRHPSKEIEQGYLAISERAEVRVRRASAECTLTVKRGHGEEREETELEIPPEQFEALWDACGEGRLEKRRHLVPIVDDLTAEVDVYAGSLQGLAVAEVEFPSREAARSFDPPAWLGREVTGDERYANQTLARGGFPEAGGGIATDVALDSGRSYRLTRDEEVATGLTRVAAGRAEAAVERLRESGAGEAETTGAVHGSRKDMKKLRTALRLLRPELGAERYRQANARFRDAARTLSDTRDAEVKLETLTALREHADGLPEEAVESWCKILDRDREAATGSVSGEEHLAEAGTRIEAGLREIQDWSLEGDGWKAIGPALTRTYRRGRKAMKAAEGGDEETIHEWRKRVKDLWYELRLLRDAWSGPLKATSDEAHRLADLLGDHHDLAVLREDLRERNLGDPETEKLAAAIGERQEEMAEEALALGRRLYAERPQDFSRRLQRYWEAWRG